jgi:hypothetical protein
MGGGELKRLHERMRGAVPAAALTPSSTPLSLAMDRYGRISGLKEGLSLVECPLSAQSRQSRRLRNPRYDALQLIPA